MRTVSCKVCVDEGLVRYSSEDIDGWFVLIKAWYSIHQRTLMVRQVKVIECLFYLVSRFVL